MHAEFRPGARGHRAVDRQARHRATQPHVGSPWERCAARRAEHAEIVQLGVAILAAHDLLDPLGLAQDILVRDDLPRGGCAARAEPGIEQAQRGGALRYAGALIAFASARARRVGPLVALIALKRQAGLGALLAAERFEERRGGAGHALGQGGRAVGEKEIGCHVSHPYIT